MSKLIYEMRNRRLFLTLMACIVFSGCFYLTMDMGSLNVEDGVEAHEAILIAQQKLIDSSLRQGYYASNAKILADEDSDQYPDYWFVTFPPNFFSSRWFTRYLVVIDRETAEVEYSGSWSARKQPGLGWVFQ